MRDINNSNSHGLTSLDINKNAQYNNKIKLLFLSTKPIGRKWLNYLMFEQE